MSFTVELSNSEMNLLHIALIRMSDWNRHDDSVRYAEACDLAKRLEQVSHDQADPHDVGRLEGYARAEVYRLLHKEAV